MGTPRPACPGRGFRHAIGECACATPKDGRTEREKAVEYLLAEADKHPNAEVAGELRRMALDVARGKHL